MKTKIDIILSKTEKVSYGTSEQEIGKSCREIKQLVSAKEMKYKTLAALEEVKQEVIEIFNREIESEDLAAAKLKAENEAK
jgi:hypothetical protein